METINLYDSNYCRLCGEENNNKTPIFIPRENSQNLADLINKYLPIKVEDDKKYPTSICPGCHIQLEATKLFMDLIVEGQAKLRNLYRVQQSKDNKQVNGTFRILRVDGTVGEYVGVGGKEFFLQVLGDGHLYPLDHELFLLAEGQQKPKRKRGRPPKPPRDPNEIDKEPDVEKSKDEVKEEEVELDDGDGRRRRRIKAPATFEGVVQGEELEKILKEEGVIDKDEMLDPSPTERCTEIIGRVEDENDESVLHNIVTTPRYKNGFHDRRKTRKKFVCEFCQKVFLYLGRFNQHRKLHASQNICTEQGCDFKTDTKEELEIHQTETGHKEVQGAEETCKITESTNDSTIADDSESPPVDCSTALTDPANVTLSVSSAHVSTEIDCSAPATNSDQAESLDDTSPSNQKFVCTVCEKTFSCRQNLTIHERSLHDGVKPYECPQCGRAFSYANSLKIHMATHETCVTKRRRFPCDVCGRVMMHQSSLLYHKETVHNNSKRFVCNKCGRFFKHRQLLQRHQAVHSDKRPYVCGVCSARFKSHGNLTMHEATHTGNKRYCCNICGARFLHKTSLTLHERWHEGKKPFKCEVCDKSFSQKGNLVEHKRTHTGEKPFCCDFCGKSFTTSSQFNLHRKRHTGERPWRCLHCQKTFLYKPTFEAHIRRHYDDRPFRCPACPSSFADKYSLMRHRRAQHSADRPYSCPRCDKKFSDGSNRRKHMRIHESRDRLAGTRLGAMDMEVVKEETTTSSTVTGVDGIVLEDVARGRKLADDLGLQITQLVDEQGNPISITTHDGLSIPIVTGSDENRVHGLLPDGSLVPIELNNFSGKETEETVINNCDYLPSLEGDMDILTAENLKDIDNQPLHANIQLLTNEQGQEMCLLAYSVDSIADEELNQQVALEPFLNGNIKQVAVINR